MRLPRLTVRRLKSLALASAGSMAWLLALATVGDERLALLGIGLIALIDLTTALPFLGYVFEVGLPPPDPGGPSRRPPRLPRLTSRRLIEFILIVTIGCTVAMLVNRLPRRGHDPRPPTKQPDRRDVSGAMDSTIRFPRATSRVRPRMSEPLNDPAVGCPS
ncbi:hypothetical protein [Singulisphaera sp. PoT]|uniref:hypothetical protein n=1 Tax=Singulisphaera sp. PoT TaxID=3411797 RepID=UPI003BF4E1CE